MNDVFSLSGKVALVTGASRGIGEEIAKVLAAAGAHVIVSSRKMEGCQTVVDAIKEAGGSAEAIPCHIGDLEQITSIFSQIEKKHGKLDVLINNAATSPFLGHILDTDLSAFQKTVDVNIRGYFFMSVAAGKLMKKGSGGAIVNVASVNGVIPGNMQGIYSISKSAVIAMTKSFAKECANLDNRVNALLPGLTETKFASAVTTNPAVMKKTLEHVPMNRAAKPSEMTGAVLYLASDAGSYTTGACLNVDGGFLTV